MIYIQLFWEFFKTGLFAVGGGLATLPFLTAVSDKTGWYTHEQLADMVAVAESTPGPIGINTATYVGFTTAGLPGGVIATLGLIMPSLVIIVIIAALLKSFKDNNYVEAIFECLRPASVALIASAGWSMALITFRNEADMTGLNTLNVKSVILAVIVFVFIQFVTPTKKWHPVVFIALSAAAGIFLL